MKKKVLLGIFVIAIIGFNISLNLKSNNGEFNLNDLVKFNASEAECNTPTWWYGTCNQRVESIESTCQIYVTVRTYTTSSGSVCGTAWVVDGVITMKSGYSTSYYTDSQSYESYTATRVNCPTDGNNNDCEEYRPCN